MQDKKNVIVRLVLVGIFIIVVTFLLVSNQNSKEKANLAENANNAESNEQSGVNTGVKADGNGQEAEQESGNELIKNLPVFYAKDSKALEVKDDFRIEDCYITSRYGAFNHFYIDEDNVLWATGRNEYGQFGTGTFGMEEYYEEPIKVAENVLMVDVSGNDYFAIYVNEAGELYGMGANYGLVLLGEGSEANASLEYTKVPKPVLLMSDVIYARAGRESIVAIKKDGSAYWWGQYAPLTHTHSGDTFNDYWKVVEDEKNPVKMLAAKPRKVMDNCRYITTGAFNGAAISENGELYTWGSNIFGQCGMPVTGDDFIRTPVKAADDVKMVWIEAIQFNDPLSPPSEINWMNGEYPYNTFILKNNDDVMAAGINLGDQQKVTEVNGDIESTEVNIYSDTFVPIQVIEYSEETNRKVLKELHFGMNKEEVEKILNEGGLRNYWMEYDDMAYFVVEDSQYYCHFDENGELEQILLQVGGSRDGRFSIGMDFSELEKIVTDAGYSLKKMEDSSEDSGERYTYRDEEQQIEYEFFIYEGKLSVLQENR